MDLKYKETYLPRTVVLVKCALANFIVQKYTLPTVLYGKVLRWDVCVLNAAEARRQPRLIALALAAHRHSNHHSGEHRLGG